MSFILNEFGFFFFQPNCRIRSLSLFLMHFVDMTRRGCCLTGGINEAKQVLTLGTFTSTCGLYVEQAEEISLLWLQVKGH